MRPSRPEVPWPALLFASLTLPAAVPLCAGQCGPAWIPGFGSPGTDNAVNASVIHDDGGGPALYVAGDFGTAGGAAASSVARWDGSSWAPVGNGPGFRVMVLASFDDGGGPDLYAGGIVGIGGGPIVDFISRWDGTTWTSIGDGSIGDVYSLCVYNDGSGAALYAGHHDDPYSPVNIHRVSRWNGASWAAVGAPVFTSWVKSLLPWDDGNGPSLFAACGSSLGSGLVRWTGGAWIPVNPNTGVGGIESLALWDDGTGTALYAGGAFTSIGGVAANRAARWTGTTFQALGGGIGPSGSFNPVRCLGVFDFGSGGGLFVGGDFTSAAGIPAAGFARWNGTSWSVPAAPDPGTPPARVECLTPWPAGPQGPSLYAGGFFYTFGSSASRCVTRWDGTTFSPLGAGNGIGFDATALVAYDDGSGIALYAGGNFPTAGPNIMPPIARYDGMGWSGLPPGPGPVGGWNEPIGTLDFLGSRYLVASGSFTNISGVPSAGIAFLGPNGWLPSPGGGVALGTGPGYVGAIATRALANWDELYIGGGFAVAGGVPAANIARFDGLNWFPLGAGLTGGGVKSLAWFDAGSSPRLYAGGTFTAAGGTPATGIAAWDGAAWTVPAGALSGPPLSGLGAWQVNDLEVFDDGSGAALYVAGSFTSAGGVAATGIARWNGASWTAVGGGVAGNFYGQLRGVYALEVFDDGRGDALYAFGAFSLAGGIPAQGIARWDGSAWEPLGAGITSLHPAYTFDLQAVDLGAGPQLFACGRFTIAGGIPSVNIASWRGYRPWLGIDGSAATGVFLRNRGLVPGAEVFNVFSLETCAGEPGSGPWLGLCATDPSFLVAQASYPAGTVPFHYSAAGPSAAFGPYPLPPGLVFDALCVSVTGGTFCLSPVRRYLVP